MLIRVEACVCAFIGVIVRALYHVIAKLSLASLVLFSRLKLRQVYSLFAWAENKRLKVLLTDLCERKILLAG
jgi:nicotinamide riboside transporter PnuC